MKYSHAKPIGVGHVKRVFYWRYGYFKSWLRFVNRLFLRWLFVRLYVKVETMLLIPKGQSLPPNGRVVEVGLLGLVYPNSGYGCDYRPVLKKIWYLKLPWRLA